MSILIMLLMSILGNKLIKKVIGLVIGLNIKKIVTLKKKLLMKIM